MHENIDALRNLRRHVPVSCGQISALYSEGAGQKVMLLHGNSSCKEVFSPVILSLRKNGHSVLAVDLPGHGESSDAIDPETTYCFPGYADVMVEVLNHFGWERFVAVGWSLGGHVALELVARRPDCIGLMIIGSPPGKPSQDALEQAFFASGSTLLAGKRDLSAEEAKLYVAHMLGAEDEFFLQKALRTDGRAREMMFASALRGVGIDQRIVAESTERPFAVVHGMKEPFVRLEYLKTLAYGRLWRNEIQTIDGVGHAPHWECPSEFSEMLLQFVAECGTQR